MFEVKRTSFFDRLAARTSLAASAIVGAGLLALPLLNGAGDVRRSLGHGSPTAEATTARIAGKQIAEHPSKPPAVNRKRPAEAAVEVAPAGAPAAVQPVRQAPPAPHPSVDRQPAIADPLVPSPPPPLPPDTWSEAEIAEASQECATILGPLDPEVEHVEPFRAGLCGAPAPILLRRLGRAGSPGSVEVQPAALTNCRIAAGLGDWVEETLQPAAREAFGSPVVRIFGASSYSCRNRYNKPDERISEHAFANAIDIAGFDLADGRRIDVKSYWGPTARDARAAKGTLAEAGRSSGAAPARKDAIPTLPSVSEKHAGDKPTRATLEQRKPWRSAGLQNLGVPSAAKPEAGAAATPTPAATHPAEAAFLHRLHAGACQIFGTVLGPEANDAHRDHFHLDMKRDRKRSFCE